MERDAALALQQVSGGDVLGAEELAHLARRAPESARHVVVVGDEGELLPRRRRVAGELGEVIGVVDARDDSRFGPERVEAQAQGGFHRLVPERGLPEGQESGIGPLAPQALQGFVHEGKRSAKKYIAKALQRKPGKGSRIGILQSGTEIVRQ